MATPSLAMIPSAIADSKVYSVLPNNGDGDFTFNRDSSATRVGSNGLIQEVGFFGSNIVQNGDFSDSSNWTLTTPWNIANGKANYDDTSSNAMYQNGITITAGKSYKITFTISNASSTAHMTIFDYASSDLLLANENWANGTYERIFTSTNNETGIAVWGNTAGSSFSIDNVSLQEVTGDQPRLNYDISNGVVQSCPSLLLEPASTNSFPNSEDYTVFSSSSNGTGTNPVITSNYSVSPDGTQNADRIQFNRGSGTSSSDTSYVTKSLSLGTIDATLSIYLKTNDGTTKDVTLRLGAGLFDYDVIVTSEWKRFTLSGNTSVDRVQILLYGHKNSESADLSCFGTQIENLSYATSYIPTLSGAIQTRAAETCNDAGNAATFNSTEGVLYAEISALADDNTDRIIYLSDGTMNNYVSIGYSRFTGSINAEMISGGVLQTTNFGATGVTQSNNNKFAFSWGSGTMKFYVNGTQTNTESVTSPTGLNVLEFNTAVDTKFMYSNTRDIRVYNEALTDAQLQTLTTL